MYICSFDVQIEDSYWFIYLYLHEMSDDVAIEIWKPHHISSLNFCKATICHVKIHVCKSVFNYLVFYRIVIIYLML